MKSYNKYREEKLKYIRIIIKWNKIKPNNMSLLDKNMSRKLSSQHHVWLPTKLFVIYFRLTGLLRIYVYVFTASHLGAAWTNI